MHIRQATIDDVLFVAQGVVMALHLDPNEQDIPAIAKICSREDVLYSYKNALIAFEKDSITGKEKPVGLCLCYDGKGYHEIRLRTFALFPDKSEDMDFEHFEDETCEGEYYIDSLAILPEYRRQGFATQLMKAQIDKGRSLGLPVATLLVDPENPNAQKLYTNLGFRYSSDVYAFGKIYWKLTLELCNG